MKAHVIAFASALMGTMPAALAAEFMHDPPWNAEHIDHLPIEVRSAVLAKCPTRPDAGHYFATFFHDEVHLHFEHFHCAGVSFCNASGCLQQTYRMSSGHYRLAGSSYKSRND
jgi:hypothetical protein